MRAAYRQLADFAGRLRGRPSKPIVPHVRISGGIDSNRTQLHLQNIKAAFATRGAKAVAITINSPGGSPVSSDILHKRIKALSAKHKIPVYIFAEEMAASAGYHIATAGNEVYANEMSLVGSIGVISMSFGVKKLMEQLNVDVRIMNKGNMKTMMSPFQDQLPEHKKHMDEILEHSYEIFKNWVKKSREGKLKDAEHADEIFSGAVFKAHRALELGLIDGIGDIHSVLEEKFGANVQIVPVKQRRNIMQAFSENIATTAFTQVEDRLMSSRFF